MLTKLSPQSFGIIACQSPAAVRACFSFDRTTLRACFLSAKFVAHFLASSAFVVPTFSYVLCFKQPPSCRTGIEKLPREKPVGKAKRRQERAFDSFVASSSIDFRPERRLLFVSLRAGQIADTKK